MEADPATPAPAPSPPRRRRAVWRRRWFRLLLLALVLGVVLVLITTRTALTRSMVLSGLRSALNADVQAGAAVLNPDGTLVLSDVVVTVPGISGPAAKVIEVDRLVADVHWGGTIRGRPNIDWVRLERPLIRISQSVDTGDLNIGALRPVSTQRTTGRQLPRIIAKDGRIELGEHRGADYAVLKQIDVEGDLTPHLREQRPAYVAQLREIRKAPDGSTVPGMIVDGLLDTDGLFVTLGRVSADDWPASAVPTRSRSLYRRLDIDGAISTTRFAYTYDGQLSARIDLADVAVTLPFELTAEYTAHPGDVRMRGVSGSIVFSSGGLSAELDGILEDLPYSVRLDYRGLELDSTFDCELTTRDFRLDRNPELLPFAPDIVREQLARFSAPTAIVDARVLISRAPPADGQASPIDVRGELSFREGSAAFFEFPYRFDNLHGQVAFDTDKIEIRTIRGRAPSGATVSATGVIGPPTELAEVDIRVQARSVPIDRTLLDAMGPGRSDIVLALFSAEQHATLVERGLIATSAQHRDARSELDAAPTPERRAELEAILALPAMDLGGLADIDIQVLRPYGYLTEWATTVDVALDQAGLVPEKFPLPIVAQDVTVHVQNDVATIRSGRFEGLRGGHASVVASANIRVSETPIAPSIEIRAHGVPVDELLIHAVPDTPIVGLAGERRGVHDVLTALGLDGAVDCSASIGPREGGLLGFDVQVAVPGIRARPLAPDGAPGALEIANMRGKVSVSERRVELDVDAALQESARIDPAPADAPERASRLAVHAVVEIAESGQSRLDASADASDLDASLPVESLVGAIMPSVAGRLAELRDRHRPAGSIDASVSARSAPGAGAVSEIRLSVPDRASFDALGGRVDVGASQGECIVGVGEPGFLRCDDFQAPVWFDGEPVGRLAASGSVTLADSVPAPRTGDRFVLRLQDAELDSSFTRRLIDTFAGPEAREVHDALAPEGRFSLGVEYLGPSPGAPAAASGERITFVEPLFVRFNHNGRRIAVDGMSGRVRLSADGGRAESLAGTIDGCTLVADGSWAPTGPGERTISASLEGVSRGIPPDILHMLPEPVRQAIESVKLSVAGTVRLSACEFTAIVSPESRGVTARGRLHVQDASLDVGLPITDADFTMDFTTDASPVNTAPGTSAARFQLAVTSDSLRVLGASMTDAAARIESGSTPGQVLVPVATAACSDGRVALQARLTPTDAGARSYQVHAQASGVQFAPVLDDMARHHAERAGLPAPEARDPGSRGTLDGQVSIAGFVDAPASRRGWGLVQISGGRIVSMPLMLRIVELGNLQPPSNERLDLAVARFFIEADEITFEDLSAFSDSVELLGYGTMRIPGRDLDLRFSSRAAGPRRIPLVSSLVEGLRNELIMISVTGPLEKPEFTPRTLSGTRRMLAEVAGEEDSERDRRMLRLAERARLERRLMESRGGRLDESAAIRAIGPEDGSMP